MVARYPFDLGPGHGLAYGVRVLAGHVRDEPCQRVAEYPLARSHPRVEALAHEQVGGVPSTGSEVIQEDFQSPDRLARREVGSGPFLR